MRIRKVSTLYPRLVAETYGDDIAQAAADSDEQVAARVAQWEHDQGPEPRDWVAIGREERADHPMSPRQGTEVAAMPHDKSVGASLVLTFLFGPFGMLYTNPVGALIMLIIALVVAVVTLGIGLIVIWPVSMLWGAISASETTGHTVQPQAVPSEGGHSRADWTYSRTQWSRPSPSVSMGPPRPLRP